MADNLKHLLWLSQIIEPGAAYQVYTYFGSATKAFHADTEDYRQIPALKAHQLKFLENKSLETAEAILYACQEQGIHILTFQDVHFPPNLRDIDAPPLVLYLRGRLLDLQSAFIVAMAGTRRATPYGESMARSLSFDLSRGGILVVTGVVEGCDQNAVLGALKAGKHVGAVVAGGVDVPYYNTPACRELYEDIAAQGFLLSEYPPGTRPVGGQFRARNRILTGMSDCVICVEGSRTSGAVQVANIAVDQGRDVFAVPANVGVPSAAGTNELIRSGTAAMLTSVEEVFDLARRRRPKAVAPSLSSGERAQRLSGEAAALSAPSGSAPKTAETPPEVHEAAPASAEKIGAAAKKSEKKVDSEPSSAYIDLNALRQQCTEPEYQCCVMLSKGDATADEIAEGCGLPIVAVNSALTVLCVRGFVVERAEGRFSLTGCGS